MNARSLVAVAFLATIAGTGHAARAEERWVDDEQVLSPRRVRLTVGIGLARFAKTTMVGQTRARIGTGYNLEEALGLGHQLEMGVRFGFRAGDAARGLRADEAARGVDTETFGTGLSITPNPELRLRWGATRSSWGEAGLELRAVLPIQPEPDVTAVLGAWTSVRVGSFGRVDAGLHGVLTSHSFAAERVFGAAFGMPVQLWANVTTALVIGVVTTTRYVAGTSYSAGYARWTAGPAVGYRFSSCDVTWTTLLPDVFGDFSDRAGTGLGLSCRM